MSFLGDESKSVEKRDEVLRDLGYLLVMGTQNVSKTMDFCSEMACQFDRKVHSLSYLQVLDFYTVIYLLT